MTEAELKLECLKLAIDVLRPQGVAADIDAVAKTQTQFYTLISGEAPASEPEKVDGRRKAKAADKSVDPFN